ncbi:MAG: N-acetyltransferase [Rhodocyclaceae bacterium]|nr:MAG: N-acetyltransferase [Rhodocyclaceae bacterium]
MPILLTPRLELRPAFSDELAADLEGHSALRSALGVAVPDSWPPELYDADAIRFMLQWLQENPGSEDWGFYYFVLNATAGASPVLIGCGGFKGAPDDSGTVEIGYSILPEYRRVGYATEAVQALVSHAFATSTVRRVIGQTLSTLDSSIRVLERAGFSFAGTGDDPDVPPGASVVCYERCLAL